MNYSSDLGCDFVCVCVREREIKGDLYNSAQKVLKGI